MGDVDDAERGPAYFFQQPYDKLVILPEAALFNGSYSKRWLDDELDSEVEKGTQSELEKRNDSFFFPQPGDRPWFCFWNNTILEGFIYVTENTTLANYSATAIGSTLSSGVTTTFGTPSISSSSCSSSTTATYAYTIPSAAPTLIPSVQLLSVPGASSAILSSMLALSSSSSSLLSTPIGGPATPISAYPSTQTSDYDKLRKRQGFSSNLLAPYSKVIKIEERRISQIGVQPYCQQMVVLDDMSIGTATNASGDLMIVQLTEEESAVQHRVVADVGPTGLVRGKDKDDRTKGDRKDGDWKNGHWQKEDGKEESGWMGNVNKREELMGRLIRELVERREHETRDSDVHDEHGCRCEWIAT